MTAQRVKLCYIAPVAQIESTENELTDIAGSVLSFPWARQQFRIIKDPPIGPPKAGDKLKILDKTSNTPLIQLEIPPPPLINAHSAATTGERPMGVQDGNGSADYTQAVDLLKDWTTKNGWHDLQSRLFEAGRTDYRDYAQVVLNTQSR